MTYPTTSALDSLAQTAPHIILFEPTTTTQPLPSFCKNLYKQKMLASERRILEQSHRKHTLLPGYTTAKRACRWYRRCCVKNLDKEEWEAMELMESAREHGLAAAYRGNASTGRLKKKKRGDVEVRVSLETLKMKVEGGRMGSVVTVETREAGDEDEGGDGIVAAGQVMRKGSVTVTTTIIPPPSSSASSATMATSEASTLPTSVRSSTDTVRCFERPSLDLSINSCEGCHHVDTAEERKGLLVKWGEVEGEQTEVAGRKWWMRLSLGRGNSFRGL